MLQNGDWDFFCDLAYVNNRWPAHVANRANNLILLFRHLEAEDIGDMVLPELPHHALLDARFLADLYRRLMQVQIEARDTTDDLPTLESAMRKALWALSHLIPGYPKATAIVDVLNDSKLL
ncbi:hypothetical protein [Pseudomonas viridiflava]|uniref:hypothetical protein n=1 Tax=Pseudomonas viridiflava TaxID=33069 RepID=UPI001F146FAA|nr:hypothetical protein [Pseudomonas viridiflava]